MKKYCTVLCLIIVVFLAGCGESKDDAKREYILYYLDSSGESLVEESYTPASGDEDAQGLLLELEEKLETGGTKDIYISPIEPDIEFEKMELKNGQLSLFFTGAYNNRSGSTEVLSRAAIVKTLCQVEGVDKVEFFVEDQSLMIRGNSIGQMDASSFVDDLGNQGTPQSRTVRLYFGDTSGQKLVAVDTTVTYPAAEKMARLLLECLIAGPENLSDVDTSALMRTVPKDTVINSVTIRDNICYVDLSREFSELLSTVSSDVTVYSIVDTLCELPAISKVQFTIDSSVRERYGETTGFNIAMERNLDIIGG